MIKYSIKVYILECIKKLHASFFIIQFKILSRNFDFNIVHVSEKYTANKTLFSKSFEY